MGLSYQWGLVSSFLVCQHGPIAVQPVVKVITAQSNSFSYSHKTIEWGYVSVFSPCCISNKSLLQLDHVENHILGGGIFSGKISCFF